MRGFEAVVWVFNPAAGIVKKVVTGTNAHEVANCCTLQKLERTSEKTDMNGIFHPFFKKNYF